MTRHETAPGAAPGPNRNVRHDPEETSKGRRPTRYPWPTASANAMHLLRGRIPLCSRSYLLAFTPIVSDKKSRHFIFSRPGRQDVLSPGRGLVPKGSTILLSSARSPAHRQLAAVDEYGCHDGILCAIPLSTADKSPNLVPSVKGKFFRTVKF